MPETTTSYEFEEFSLFPTEKVLLHLGAPVRLLGKDLAILDFLVTHPKQDLSPDTIIEAVWGTEADLANGNLTNHVAKIRKVLGCDRRRPKYIKTLNNGRGYRFIAVVEKRESGRGRVEPFTVSSVLGNSRPITLTANLFVPVFLGEEAHGRIAGIAKKSEWGDYTELEYETGRLCICRSGVGVWHIRRTQEFTSLSEVAVWRRSLYHEILGGKHLIKKLTSQLIKGVDDRSPIRSHIGHIEYALSAVVLTNSVAKNERTARNVLKVLASPSTLEATDESKKADSLELERRFLENGIETPEGSEFGLPGRDLGFATWDGVAYSDNEGGQGPLAGKLVEFEVAVQSLWWLCKCLIDSRSRITNKDGETVRKYLAEVRHRYAALRAIGSMESQSQRTMIEAILKTSRIGEMVDEAAESLK